MKLTHTHTYATLEVLPSTFEDIKKRLEAAEYDHAFHDDIIDMHGIGLVALKPEPKQRPSVWPTMSLVTRPDAVNEVLARHGLESESVPIEMAMGQYGAMSSGQPALLLVLEVNGQKVLAKTSLQLMESAVQAIRSVSGMSRDL